jgi:hypothetical protein
MYVCIIRYSEYEAITLIHKVPLRVVNLGLELNVCCALLAFT